MYVIYPKAKEEDFKFEYHKVVGEKIKGDPLQDAKNDLLASKTAIITNKQMCKVTNKFPQVTFTAYLPEEFK